MKVQWKWVSLIVSLAACSGSSGSSTSAGSSGSGTTATAGSTSSTGTHATSSSASSSASSSTSSSASSTAGSTSAASTSSASASSSSATGSSGSTGNLGAAACEACTSNFQCAPGLLCKHGICDTSTCSTGDLACGAIGCDPHGLGCNCHPSASTSSSSSSSTSSTSTGSSGTHSSGSTGATTGTSGSTGHGSVCASCVGNADCGGGLICYQGFCDTPNSCALGDPYCGSLGCNGVSCNCPGATTSTGGSTGGTNGSSPVCATCASVNDCQYGLLCIDGVCDAPVHCQPHDSYCGALGCSGQSCDCAAADGGTGGSTGGQTTHTIHGTAVVHDVNGTPAALVTDYQSTLSVDWNIELGPSRLSGGGPSTSSPGIFDLAGVPDDSTVLLHIGGSPVYAQTRSSTIDFGFTAPARTGYTGLDPNGTPVNVSVNLTHLLPLRNDGQYVQVAALNGDFLNFNLLYAMGYTAGATSLSGSVNWATLNQIYPSSTTVDPTQGDTLYVSQLASVDAGDHGATTEQTLKRFIDLTGTTIYPGGSLTGALADVPQDAHVTVSIPRSGAAEADLTPGAVWTQSQLDMGVLPHAAQYGVYSGFPDLKYATTTAPGTVPFLVDSDFGNPYPASWDPVAQLFIAYDLPIEVSPGITQHNLLQYGHFSTLADMPAVWTPSLGPVRNIRVNGLSADADLRGVGYGAVVTWDPPAVGTPTAYLVTTYEESYDQFGQGLQYGYVTSTTLLPESRKYQQLAFFTQNTYVVVIRAISMPDTDLSVAPFRFSFPYDYSENMTHLLNPYPLP